VLTKAEAESAWAFNSKTSSDNAAKYDRSLQPASHKIDMDIEKAGLSGASLATSSFMEQVGLRTLNPL